LWDLQKGIGSSDAYLLSPNLSDRAIDAANWELFHSTGRMFDRPEKQLLAVDLVGKSAKSLDGEGITGGLPKLWVNPTDINDDPESIADDSSAAFLMAELDRTEVDRGAVESGVYRSLIAGAKLKQFSLWSNEEKSQGDIPGSQSDDAVDLERSTFFPGVFLETDRQSQEYEAGLSPGTLPPVRGRNFSLNNFAQVPEAYSPSIAHQSSIDHSTPHTDGDPTPHFDDPAFQQPTNPLPWQLPTSWEVEPKIELATTQTYIDDSETFIPNDQPANLNFDRLLISDFDRKGDRAIPKESIHLVPREIPTAQSWQSTVVLNSTEAAATETLPEEPDLRNTRSWRGLPTEVAPDLPPLDEIGISTAVSPKIPTAQSWQSTVGLNSTETAATETLPLETELRNTRSWGGLPAEVAADRSQLDLQYGETSTSWQSWEVEPFVEPSIEPSWGDRESSTPTEKLTSEPETFSDPENSVETVDRENPGEIEFQESTVVLGLPTEVSSSVVDLTNDRVSGRSQQIDSFFPGLNPESQVALMPPPILPRSLPATESVTAPLKIEFPGQDRPDDLMSINSAVLESSVSDPNDRSSSSKVYSSLIDRDVQESLGAIARETNSMPGVLYVLPSADYIELMLLSPGQPISRRIITTANGETLNATVQELIAEVTNPRTFGSDRYLNAAQ
jgi:hypothetical protein